jgi:hypothetical protein
MSSSQTTCPNCGAPLKRVLCEYCGTLGVAHPVLDEQRQALEVFHGLLAGKDEKAQINLLKNGFLPDDRDVLIEAGLRCVALMGYDNTDDVDEASIGRLRAISRKLRYMPGDEQARRAAEDFEKEIGRYRNINIRNLIFGLLMILVPACLVIGLIVWVAGMLIN